MTGFKQGAVLWMIALSSVVLGASSPAQSQSLSRLVLSNGTILLPGMQLSPPRGWRLHQDAIADGTLLLGFSKGDDYVTLYVRHQTGLLFKKIFQNDVEVEDYLPEDRHGDFTWQNLVTSKASENSVGRQTLFMNSFMRQSGGFTYYGYSRSDSKAGAMEATASFLDGMRQPERSWLTPQSLTASDYTGKKFYLGFGDKLSGYMGNEVKYDLAHTHDIFTGKLGGEYQGTKLLGAEHDDVIAQWKKIRSEMEKNDMYVQYSSGHGSEEGLLDGVSYDEIRDNALSLPAREVIIFTMACYSGNLVKSFNRRREVWQNWEEEGRTLLVMTSSQPDETSQTGPGKDGDEPHGPKGSAGSAFGHALWKALIGYADGYVDGVKDGFVSLGEIKAYTRDVVRKLTDGTQNPVFTGVFNPGLIMNRVPSSEYLESLGSQSTEGMDDAKIEQLVRKLDEELAVK